MRRGLPIASSSSIKSHSYNQSPCCNNEVSISVNGMPSYHQRSFPLSLKRTMSTRPSYAVSEIGDDDAGDDHADEEESLLNLLNSSKISNGPSLSHIHRRRQSDGSSDEKVSLVQLMNNDRVKYSRKFSRDDIEVPLLQKVTLNVEEYPESSSEVLHSGVWETYRLHQQNEKGKSVLDFLNIHTSNQSHSPSIGFSGHQEQVVVEDANESLHELLNDETESAKKNVKYKDLYRLQLQLEAESTEEAIRKHLEVWNSARDRSDHETIPAVRRALGSWFGPLTEAIELEQWLYLNHDYKTCTYNHLSVHGDQPTSIPDSDDTQDETSARPRSVKDRSVYGPLLCLLPPKKIAVLLAHTALSMSLADRDGESKVLSLALQIAEVLEMEVNVSRALRVRARERKRKVNSSNMEEGDDFNRGKQGMSPDHMESHEIDDQSDRDPIDRWAYSASHLQRFLDEISGGSSTGEQNSLKGVGRVRPVIVRKRCKEILLAEGFVAEGMDEKGGDELSSLDAFVEWDPVKKVKLGAALLRLLLDHTAHSKPLRAGLGCATPEPAFQYLRKKNSNGKTHGCISIHPDLFRIAVEEELSLTSLQIPLSTRNDRVQPMVVPPKEWTDINNGGYETIKVPFMRTRHCKTQKVSSLHFVSLSGVSETFR